MLRPMPSAAWKSSKRRVPRQACRMQQQVPVVAEHGGAAGDGARPVGGVGALHARQRRRVSCIMKRHTTYGSFHHGIRSERRPEAATHRATDEWQQTACILCECNCGIEVRLGGDGRTLRTDPRRQGPPGVAGLHVREGAAARPLPERPRRPAACARCAAGRTARYEEIDWDTAIARGRRAARARCATPTAARRSSTTAAAGRATTWAAPTARRRCAALGEQLPLERPRAGEDRRVLGQRQDVSAAPCAATSSTARWRSSSARTRGTPTASRTPARR